MPPRTPEQHPIARPERSDGKAVRRPPPERVKFAMQKLLKDKLDYAETVEALIAAFDIGDRTAKGDIAEARIRIEDSLRSMTAVYGQRKYAELDAIAVDARAAEDYTAAVSAIDKQLKLVGAYAPEKHEHRVLSDEDYAKALDEMIPMALERAQVTDLVAELERRGIKVAEDVHEA